MELYKDALLREIDSRKGFFSEQQFISAPNTLYIGGGTPSLAHIGLWREVSDKLSALFPFEEFTVEVNPDDVTPEYARGLRSIGVDRISMGVQSFNDNHLRWMNRRHTAQEAIGAFDILRSAGFENISLDLIFGYNPHFGKNLRVDYPSLWEVWKQDIRTILKLAPEHISAYQMGIEEDALLGKKDLQGEYTGPEDDFCAREYEYLQEQMDRGGYLQYEISNFSLKGKESVHNSAYWKRVPYLGFGPGAHSFYENIRRWNHPDLGLYLKGVDYFEEESLTREDVFIEKVFLGLRSAGGLSVDSGMELNRVALEKFLSEGVLIRRGDFLYLSPQKYFISDSIIRELI